MTTADLLAADFQLRSSNILVAPLDAAGVYPRGDLVVYRACAGAEFFGCNALFTLAAEQHDLVPDLDTFIDPEDTSIHGDPPEERAPLAPDQGLSPSRERPPISLRVPYRHGRREHRRPGTVGQSVGYPVPPGESPHAGDVALECHRGPETLRRRVSLMASRVQTVERNAGTDAIVVRAGMPEGGRRVCGVHQDTPEGVRGEDGLEALDLASRRPLVGIGRGEMRVEAGEPRAKYLARLPHLRGLHSPAVHPRVHLQVCLETWVGRYAPRARDGVGRHGQAMFPGQPQPVRREVGEAQDRHFKTRAPQLCSFLDGDDGERICPGPDTGAGHFHRAVAVSVRLDHGHQARVRGLAFECAHVVAHGARIHLSPGTARDPDSGGRAAHGRTYRWGLSTWRVRISMRVITPRRASPSATGRILTLLSAMMVEASARVASGEMVISSLVITSSTVTPALLSASLRYSSQLPSGMRPPRMSRKPGALMSASRKIRSPSVTIPTSLPSWTTGAPEIPVSAKSLIAASTVSSGPSVGHSECEISATFNSLISCCSMLYPPDRRSRSHARYCKRTGKPPAKVSTPCLRLRSPWPAGRRGRTRRARR